MFVTVRDTAGQERFEAITKQFYRRAQVGGLSTMKQCHSTLQYIPVHLCFGIATFLSAQIVCIYNIYIYTDIFIINFVCVSIHYGESYFLCRVLLLLAVLKCRPVQVLKFIH